VSEWLGVGNAADINVLRDEGSTTATVGIVHQRYFLGADLMPIEQASPVSMI